MPSRTVRRPLITSACLAALTLTGCDAADDLELADEPVVESVLASTNPNDNQLDESFGGGDGIKRAYSNRSALQPHAVSVTSDHKVLFTARRGDSASSAGVYVGRLTATGDEDPTWVNGSYATITLASDAMPGGVQQLGAWTYVSGEHGKKPFLTRLSARGVVDGDFNNVVGGVKEYDTPWHFDEAGFFNLTRTADGHLVAGGWGKSGHTEYLLVARLEAENGAPDTGFGTNGFARVAVGEFGADLGGWVAVGKGRNDVFACMIAGRQVHHFDEDGKRDTGYDGITYPGCDGLAVTSQGIAYVAGRYDDDDHHHLGTIVEALDSRGKPLAHFGGIEPPGAHFDTDGMTFVTTSSQGFRPASVDYSEELERLYVVGWGVSGNEWKTVVAALRPDGRRDRTFGGEGIVTANIGATDFELPQDAVMDGRRLVAITSLANNDTGPAPKGVGVIRWAIDSGRDGEPCQSHACPDESVCTVEHPHSINVRTCQLPEEPPPPPSTPDIMTICANAPIPVGYVKVDDVHSGSTCHGTNNLRDYNVWSLRRYTGAASGATMSVCTDTGVPSGWSFVGYDWSASRCGHYETRTDNIMTIRRD